MFAEILEHERDRVPKRLRMAERGWLHQERKRMATEDKHSDMQGKIDDMTVLLEANPRVEVIEKIVEVPTIVEVEKIVIEEKIIEKVIKIPQIIEVEKFVVEERIIEKVIEIPQMIEVEKIAVRPDPLFQAGQAVHQWWATWMPGAAQPPSSIKKGMRPQWYTSSIMSPPEWTTISYGGSTLTTWGYKVY